MSTPDPEGGPAVLGLREVLDRLDEGHPQKVPRQVDRAAAELLVSVVPEAGRGHDLKVPALCEDMPSAAPEVLARHVGQIGLHMDGEPSQHLLAVHPAERREPRFIERSSYPMTVHYGPIGGQGERAGPSLSPCPSRSGTPRLLATGRAAPASDETSENEAMEISIPQVTDRYLTNAEAAAVLKLSPRTLEKLRVNGGGPRFRKFGSRVIYAREDLDAWANARICESTSDDRYVALR